VHFIVRHHDQARITVRADRPLGGASTGEVVVADQLVTLGAPTYAGSVVVPELRLVTSVNAADEPLRLVTDRFDLPALVVLQIYRRRWQIERFFRWLKHHLGLLHPLGHSPQAIWLSVLLLACVAVLAMLLEPLHPPSVSRIAFLRTLAVLLPRAINSGYCASIGDEELLLAGNLRARRHFFLQAPAVACGRTRRLAHAKRSFRGACRHEGRGDGEAPARGESRRTDCSGWQGDASAWRPNSGHRAWAAEDDG